MSTPSSPLGSHDLTDVVGLDLRTTLAAFEGDVRLLDPDLGRRIARTWQETLRQGDWPNGQDLADRWERLEDLLDNDDAEEADLADVLLDLADGHRVLAGEADDERLAPELERLATALAAAGEDLGGRETSAHAPRVDGGQDR